VTNISHKTLPQVKVYEAIDNSSHTAYTLYLKHTIGSLRPGQTDTHVIHDATPGRMAYYYTTHYLAEVSGMQTTVGAWTQSKLVPQT
jgi:uncharacterized circularly permuted ATP-grasp superfamily protein